MAAIDRPLDRASRRAELTLIEIGREIRTARITHGLSQASVAAACGLHQSQVSRIERGRHRDVPLRTLIHLAAVIGLDVTSRVFPAGSPIRDAAHVALLERLRRASGPSWSWRSEVPLPISGDRRAWDRVMQSGRVSIAIEAETRPTDLQELERRLALKRRDGGVDRMILLLRDSRWNRTLVRMDDGIQAAFPIPGPQAMRALADGRDPGGDAVIFL